MTCAGNLWSYHVHDVAWPWVNLKGHIKVNVNLLRDFHVENIAVQLPHGRRNSWRVIVFTRPWFRARLKGQIGHTKVNIKLGWKSDENTAPCKATWCKQMQIHNVLPSAAIWPWPKARLKGQKVKHRTPQVNTSVVITWCLQFLRNYHIYKAAWLWASLIV